MVETSLVEIFSGDVPRIHNMVIVLDQIVAVKQSSLLSHSIQSMVKSLAGFNVPPSIVKTLRREFFPPVNFVFLVRADGGFKIECGDLPERFKGIFPLEYQVSFKESGLPIEDKRVLSRVKRIKELDVRLTGKVGFNAWVMTGQLWAEVKALNGIVDSFEETP